MKILNIDEALKLPEKFRILNCALDDLFASRQEEFQKDNPITKIYKMVPLNQFQKSFSSSTGFKQAFEQTVDYAAYPGFNSGEGFKATVGYKAFSGKVVFTWQALLEGDASGFAKELSDFQVAWQRQVVEFAMFATTGFFGNVIVDPVSKTRLKIYSADTKSGDIMDDEHNPVFSNAHTIVRSEGMSDEEFEKYKQSNKYYVDVDLVNDPLATAKLANALYQIKVRMNKLYDDNGQRAGLRGRKRIVTTEDAQLNMVLDSVLAADNFSMATGTTTLNMVKNGFDTYYTPYLDGTAKQAIPQFATDEEVGHARGMLILDPEYNNANNGPMMIERFGFQMKAVKTDEPDGIKYLAKQAFDFACPSWRGVAYLYIGKPNGEAGKWNDITTFTEIVPNVQAKAVQVVGTVATKEVE